ncbi:MAG: alpha-amylase domain-containing protein [Bacteroidota bacterium]
MRFGHLVAALSAACVSAGAAAGGPSPENTPKSDVFMQGFFWNSTPGGIWWDSLKALAPRIGSAGFGGIWFPSPVKGQGGGFSMGYDPYDHYDFGEYNQKGTVETRFGSRQELLDAIGAFHTVGVQVFADAVMGHMNGGEQLIPFDCEPYPSYPDSGYLLFQYPSGSGRFPKNATHFYPNQITCDVNPPYHGPSDPAFKFGEVPAHAQAHVKDSLIVWGQYLRNVMAFDGFRIDAVKHIDPIFVGPWVAASGGYAVCEYYGSTSEISNWLHWAQTVFGGDVSMFDFPLRFTLQDMCNNTSGTFDMNNLDGAGLVNAGVSGYDVATFVENHDLDRTGWDGSTDVGHNPILTDKDMAYGYVLFHEGRPCVFFRDYFTYGLDGVIDRMIWIREKFLWGSTTKRDGLAPWYVGGSGSQLDQSRDLYVARRNGGSGRPQAFLVLNDHPTQWRGVWVNSSHPNQVFRDYTGAAIDKQAAGDGRVELWAPPRGIAVYVPDTTQRVNRHPYISFVQDLTAFGNTPFQFQVRAGDLDGDSLSWGMSGHPAWLSMDSTGLLGGTPLPSDTGSSQVVVTVSDPYGGSTSDTFGVSVRNRPLMDGVFEGAGIWGSPLCTADTSAGWDGARARALYVTQDDDYWYFGADVRSRQAWNWAFLINSRSGGGSNESWSRSIVYAHTSKPDVILRGHFGSYGEMHSWNGSWWSGVGTPLGAGEFGESISLDSLEDGWVEGRISKAALGNVPGLAVQFYLTGNLNAHATFDACPDDENTSAWSGVTTSLHYYARTGGTALTEVNLQFPPSAVIAGGGSATIYARAFGLGITDSAGQGAGVTAWIGWNDGDTDPATWTEWTPAAYNVDAAGMDEYQADIGSTLSGGTYRYASRFQHTGGPYLYGGYSTSGGGFWNGTANTSGLLTVEAVPAAPELSSPPDGAADLMPSLTLVWEPVGGAARYRVVLAADSMFASPVLDDSSLTGTSRAVAGLSWGATHYWRVRARNAYGWGPWSARWDFGVVGEQTAGLFVRPGWNALALPLAVPDGRRTVVFPSSVSSGFAFHPAGGYVLRDTLWPGTGYWLKFAAEDTVHIGGAGRELDTLEVQSGWNLIGGLSLAVPASAVVQIPDSIVRSAYFSYDGSYDASDTLLPGSAYWVKVAGGGKLVMTGGSPAPAERPAVPRGAGREAIRQEPRGTSR